MNKFQIDTLSISKWTIQYYWLIILLLITWTIGLTYLVLIDIEIAKIILSGSIIFGGILALVLFVIAERSKKYSDYYWWAWVILLILTGAPLGYFVILTMFSDIWIIVITVIGGIFGLSILFYYWRCMKKGI